MVVLGEGGGEVTVHLTKLSAENLAHAPLFGLGHRLGDAAAMSANKQNGMAPSSADKLAAIKRIADHLNSGSTNWSPKAAANSRHPR